MKYLKINKFDLYSLEKFTPDRFWKPVRCFNDDLVCGYERDARISGGLIGFYFRYLFFCC